MSPSGNHRPRIVEPGERHGPLVSGNRLDDVATALQLPRELARSASCNWFWTSTPSFDVSVEDGNEGRSAPVALDHHSGQRGDQRCAGCDRRDPHPTMAKTAQASGRFDVEIVPVTLAQRKGDPIVVSKDEHPRATTIEALAALKPIVRPDGTITAGNASGVNDGAAALIVASETAAKAHGLTPRARILGVAAAGVEPRVMGIGPVPATRKLLARLGLSIGDIDVVELNEAFAAQGLAVLRDLGLPDDGDHVNPNGGAIALGHPLGMSGARLGLTLIEELHRRGARYGLATMCIGVGQGIAMVVERV